MPSQLTAQEKRDFNVNQKIEALQEQLDTWTARFQKDPAYAMEWSDDTFIAAADLQVWKGIKEMFDSGSTAQEVVAILNDKAIHGARFPKHSSSASGNIMSQQMTAACAKGADDLKWYVRSED